MLFESRRSTIQLRSKRARRYEGYLVADAHAVYDHLYTDGKVTEVNCWAHARRYFFKAMFSDPTRARAALGLINALFRIERGLADSPKKKRETIRRSKSKPLVDHFLLVRRREGKVLATRRSRRASATR